MLLISTIKAIKKYEIPALTFFFFLFYRITIFIQFILEQGEENFQKQGNIKAVYYPLLVIGLCLSEFLIFLLIPFLALKLNLKERVQRHPHWTLFFSVLIVFDMLAFSLYRLIETDLFANVDAAYFDFFETAFDKGLIDFIPLMFIIYLFDRFYNKNNSTNRNSRAYKINEFFIEHGSEIFSFVLGCFIGVFIYNSCFSILIHIFSESLKG